MSWEKEIYMGKGNDMKMEMDKARKRGRRQDGFKEVVARSARLKRACRMGGEGAAEASGGDMRALWVAFVKYIEIEQGDAGEMPVGNLGAITGEEGRRSRVTWEVENVQDMFYGGKENKPETGQGHQSKRGARNEGGKGGRQAEQGKLVVGSAALATGKQRVEARRELFPTENRAEEEGEGSARTGEGRQETRQQGEEEEGHQEDRQEEQEARDTEQEKEWEEQEEYIRGKDIENMKRNIAIENEMEREREERTGTNMGVEARDGNNGGEEYSKEEQEGTEGGCRADGGSMGGSDSPGDSETDITGEKGKDVDKGVEVARREEGSEGESRNEQDSDTHAKDKTEAIEAG